MPDETYYGLSDDDCVRLKDMLDAWEKGRLNPIVPIPSKSRNAPLETLIAQTTGTITALSGTTPGEGDATVGGRFHQQVGAREGERDEAFPIVQQPLVEPAFLRGAFGDGRLGGRSGHVRPVRDVLPKRCCPQTCHRGVNADCVACGEGRIRWR